MVIVSILAVVAIPRMFDTTAFRSRGFYEELVNAARYGQKLAVASGCAVQLSISGSGFSLHQRQNCSGGNFDRPVPRPAGSAAFAAAAPSGVTLSASTASVVFDSLGRATPGNVTVSVDSHSFSIAGESGYVEGS